MTDVQEQREELEMIAFVLSGVNETTLKAALKLTANDIAELRSLLRDDHHGICLIIRLLQRHSGAQSQMARRCPRVDTMLHNRFEVRRFVSGLLSELHVILSNPQLHT